MKNFIIMESLILSVGYNRPELQKMSLESIRDNQEEILISNSAIALETKILLDLEKKLYKSLSKVDNLAQNASALIRITEHAKELFEIQELTYELAKDHPYLLTIVAAQEVELLKQTTYLFTDLLIATKSSLSDRSIRCPGSQ